jgi:hypothetical protein
VILFFPFINVVVDIPNILNMPTKRYVANELFKKVDQYFVSFGQGGTLFGSGLLFAMPVAIVSSCLHNPSLWDEGQREVSQNRMTEIWALIPGSRKLELPVHVQSKE